MANRLGKIIRLLALSPAEFAYVRLMKASGLFDRQFYVSTNPRMHRLHRMFPERHFLLHGENAGLYPNPEFSPHAYLIHNPDVARTGARPFEHYLRSGRHEVRVTKHLPESETSVVVPVPALRDRPARRARFAIVAHLFYHELWEEFRQVLRAVDIDFDLFVTITVKGKDASGAATSSLLHSQVLTDFPDAKVFEMPNHGRDIFPFVHLINAGWLEGYEAVCKIHTKKSPHRTDGDHWRRHLISGVLPPQGASALLTAFLADEDAAYWVADGQHYAGTQWWGSNFERVTGLLHRVEISTDRGNLSFPAGSIYWLKPLMIEMIRGLQLTEDQFEREMGMTDGTLAHAVERALGRLAEASGLQIRQTSQLALASRPTAMPRPKFVQAFYLPQFHPVPENDRWWGTGYTEWTATTRARPQFTGHQQPQLPTDLGFYDLRVTEVMGQQAALARSAGIDAFCVYHYWFDGHRILEAPIDRLLTRPEIDFPFYLCWANESWRRNWDGLSGEVLMPQTYAPGWEDTLAESLLPYFSDPRYQRPDGVRPRFVIYRPEDLPDPEASLTRLRAAWVRLGVGEVELGAVRFHVPGEHPVRADLFDFWIEMPPHGLVGEDDYLFGGPKGNRMTPGVSAGFQGLIYDYTRLADTACSRSYVAHLPPNTIAGLMPSWDNTARRGARAHIAWGANPASFDRWLRRILAGRLSNSYGQELFLNAWNEWAEKAVLEPAAQYGHSWLNVLARRLRPSSAFDRL